MEERIYCDVEAVFGRRETAAAVIVPVPYDGTSTWGKGADRGPEALLDASDNMELYDIETGVEVHRKGVHLAAAVTESASPESMCAAVKSVVAEVLAEGKVSVLIGGEHSVSIGAIEACAQAHEGLTVLQIDAHADLRPSYLGSACNHACALHWASRHCNLVQVGIRSMDKLEKEFEQPGNVFYASDCHYRPDAEWIEAALNRCGTPGSPLYLTIDLDAFDPGHCPDTGTPEPGGLNWYQVTALVRGAMERFNVVGFDVVELAAHAGSKPSDFLAAKLVQKMLVYRLREEVDLA